MKTALAASLSLLVSPAFAQTTDWCAAPLPLQADPQTALVWRLRCTIQILDSERIQAEDHVTAAEIDKAVAEAHMKAVQGQLDEANKKLTSSDKKQ